MSEVEAAACLAPNAKARDERVDERHVHRFQSALKFYPLAIFSRKADIALTEIDPRRQQFVTAIARDDTRRAGGAKIDAAHATLKRRAPQIGLQIGIRSYPERHTTDAFRQHTRLAPPVTIIDLGACGGQIQRAQSGLRKLRVGNDGWSIVKYDARVHDGGTDRKLRRARQHRVLCPQVDIGSLVAPFRPQPYHTAQSLPLSGKAARKRPCGRLSQRACEIYTR